MRVELSGEFHTHPKILAAQKHSRMASSLFVYGLTFMADHGWDPNPDSDRCFPGPFAWMWLQDQGVRQVGRVSNALERAGLWERITDRKGREGEAWWFLEEGDLWRITPNREPISRNLRAQVIERDGRICQLCGDEIPPGDVLHLDHKIPVAHHGRSTLENLQVAHAECNLRKGAKLEVRG